MLVENGQKHSSMVEWAVQFPTGSACHGHPTTNLRVGFGKSARRCPEISLLISRLEMLNSCKMGVVALFVPTPWHSANLGHFLSGKLSRSLFPSSPEKFMRMNFSSSRHNRLELPSLAPVLQNRARLQAIGNLPPCSAIAPPERTARTTATRRLCGAG
jgi:hypothetical protein